MRGKLLLTAVLLVAMLAGCGGPKQDVPMFMIAEAGLTADMGDKLEEALRKELGETTTIAVSTSPIYNLEKLIVELAAGDNGIMIIPQEQFNLFAQQGGLVVLDDLLSAEKFPEGVVEVPADPKKPDPKAEKHLFGVPMSKTKWLKDAGYKGKELVAFVHPRAPKLDKALEVIKLIAESP